MNEEQIWQKYQSLFGYVPSNIENRLALAKKAERFESNCYHRSLARATDLPH